MRFEKGVESRCGEAHKAVCTGLGFLLVSLSQTRVSRVRGCASSRHLHTTYNQTAQPPTHLQVVVGGDRGDGVVHLGAEDMVGTGRGWGAEHGGRGAAGVGQGGTAGETAGGMAGGMNDVVLVKDVRSAVATAVSPVQRQSDCQCWREHMDIDPGPKHVECAHLIPAPAPPPPPPLPQPAPWPPCLGGRASGHGRRTRCRGRSPCPAA